MEIVELNVYPIKGCRGTSLQVALIGERGIRFDRHWMIVRAEDGRFLTQRDVPDMARIVPTVNETGLSLTFDNAAPLLVPHIPECKLSRRIVTVWGYTGEAVDCGDLAADWFSHRLGFACRLVRTPDDFTRRLDPNYSRPEDRVGFADGYPFLLATLSSLDDLNARLVEKGADPVPMNRFRPNIVVRGTTAWEEDNWETVTDSRTGLTLRVAKPCGRCAVTTVDQITGEKTGVEPLATLAQFRRDADGKVNFATNLIQNFHGATFALEVGDMLTAR